MPSNIPYNRNKILPNESRMFLNVFKIKSLLLFLDTTTGDLVKSHEVL